MESIEFKTMNEVKKFEDYDNSKHKGYAVSGNKLKVVPDGKGIGWFSDSQGSLLYQNVSGNFMVETEVDVFRLDGKPGLPKAQFSSAGLLIKNAGDEKGKATWVMYNGGYQNSFWGRELKVTRKSNGFKLDPMYMMGYKSLSTLYMIPASQQTLSVKLRLARIDGEIRAYYSDASGKWQEEKPIEEMEVMGNGAKYPVEDFNKSVFRPKNFGLEDSVQVGIITNPGMKTSNPLMRFRDAGFSFHYFNISKVQSFSECTK